jgi:hypothetical protein
LKTFGFSGIGEVGGIGEIGGFEEVGGIGEIFLISDCLRDYSWV